MSRHITVFLCGVECHSTRFGPGTHPFFTMYTAPTSRIFQKHGVGCTTHADDIQIYVSFNPIIHGDQEQSLTRLTACLAELRQWMVLHRLKINDDKTEVIRFVSKYNVNKRGDPVFCPINIGNSSIVPTSHVRNLGVIIDD